MIFIIMLFFMAVSCTQAEDPCKDYEGRAISKSRVHR